LLRRVPLNTAGNNSQTTAAAPADPAAEKSGIERRRHPRVSLAETDTPPSREDRRSGDRRVADSSSYTGPERRRGERRSFDEVRNGLQWGAAEHKSKFELPRNSIFKPARLMLLAVALIAGGLAAIMVSSPQQTPVEPAAIADIAPPTGTRILVARQPIGVGERLSGSTVAWEYWPSASVRPEYVTEDDAPQAIDEMTGTVARFELFAGEPIREDKLARNAQGYLSAVLPSGMRGVSVGVTAQAASGGFIVPNDQVDVILTRPSVTGQVSETVLHNVRVLAINTRLGETGQTGAPADPDDPRAEIFADMAIATLALDSRQAEVIVNASSIGPLTLALRSMADFSEPDTTAQLDTNQAIRISSPFWNPNYALNSER